MKKYFLHNGTQQEGPFSIEELKTKNLTKDTPVWFEGLAKWSTIGNIEELKDIISSTPPPFTSNQTIQHDVQSAAQQKFSIPTSKKNNSQVRWLLILGGAAVLILVVIFLYNKIQHQQHEEVQDVRQNEKNLEEDKKVNIRNNITSYVTAEPNEYIFNKLGGIYNLKITVTNTTDYLLEKVQVNIIYIKATGETWDTKLVDFNMIAPNTKVTIPIEDTDRGTSIKYEIVSIKSQALGLN